MHRAGQRRVCAGRGQAEARHVAVERFICAVFHDIGLVPDADVAAEPDVLKYYLREGLLPPGRATSANQADYGDDHLRRLRLVRALIEVGGVSIVSARTVIQVIDSNQVDRLNQLGAVHEAVTPRSRSDRSSDEWIRARAKAVQYVTGRGWLVHPEAVGFDLLADTFVALESLQAVELLGRLDTYAETAHTLASAEVGSVLSRQGTDNMLELVVMGTVLGESLFNALRLLAHESESAVRLGTDPATASR